MFAANFWVKNLGHNLLRDHLILTKISFFSLRNKTLLLNIFWLKKALMDTLTYSAMDQAIFIITLLVILIVIILKITIRYKKVTWTLIPTNTMTLQMSTKVLV